jgi:hypothetical protein
MNEQFKKIQAILNKMPKIVVVNGRARVFEKGLCVKEAIEGKNSIYTLYFN